MTPESDGENDRNELEAARGRLSLFPFELVLEVGYDEFEGK